VHGIDALIKNATTVLHYLKNRVIASQKWEIRAKNSFCKFVW
jgi:hypothetical protein